MAVKTGIVMVNMGGPLYAQESSKYLLNLFNDKEIINIPMRKILAPLISSLRGKKLEKKYNCIGGGSPIHKWTHFQGERMCNILNKSNLLNAPFKYYVGFRYVAPYTQDAITAALNDGAERIVLFSQYPQFSCTTSGSSFNEAFEFLKNHSHNAKISIIDSWFDDQNYINTFSSNIKFTLNSIDKEYRDNIPIIFTAHSLPLSVVKKGDRYPLEIASTVGAVVKNLRLKNPHYLAWQSKVGLARWLEPDTDVIVEKLIKNGVAENGIILAPVSFTSDHIETSYDLDIKLKNSMKDKYGFDKLYRISSFNDKKSFYKCLAEIVINHLTRPEPSLQYMRRCHECVNPRCQNARDYLANNST